MRESNIAAIIERDLLRADDGKPSDAIECHACGRSMTYKGSRFCTERCRDYYDSGAPGYAQRQSTNNCGMRMGPNGFYVRCVHCHQELESKGVRCCSAECERRYVERQANLAVMAEVGIKPSAKRRCERCGCAIPNWRNGRRVAVTTRFCSDRCSRKACKLAA
jgi:hypothetical protein